MATMPVEQGFYVTSPFGNRDGEWAGMHWGTDFGHDGGSGGYPVFAVKSGTVQYAGGASGFGMWVTIDHPTEVGGGYSVYGHTVPEVVPGQWVNEGDRIARINPDSSTNGGVAPHLHFEWHRFVWSQPGPDRLDPETTVLAGAVWPGGAPVTVTNSTREESMSEVIYGIDISNHQPDIDLHQVGREGFEWVIIKANEGTWRDRFCRRHIDAARAAGLEVGVYCYVVHDATPDEHADTLNDVVGGDTSLPVALDIEDGSGHDVGHFHRVKDAIEARGYRVFLTYMPSWYWRDRLGRPQLDGLPPLWTSWYPDNNVDFASTIYERSGDAGWQGYGGLDVAIWQFTSSANVAWHDRGIDAGVFRGSREDLHQLFTGKPAGDKDIKELESMRIQSAVNESKTFEAEPFFRIQDRTLWEVHKMLRLTLQMQGVDVDKFIQDEIDIDNGRKQRPAK